MKKTLIFMTVLSSLFLLVACSSNQFGPYSLEDHHLTWQEQNDILYYEVGYFLTENDETPIKSWNVLEPSFDLRHLHQGDIVIGVLAYTQDDTIDLGKEIIQLDRDFEVPQIETTYHGDIFFNLPESALETMIGYTLYINGEGEEFDQGDVVNYRDLFDYMDYAILEAVIHYPNGSSIKSLPRLMVNYEMIENISLSYDSENSEPITLELDEPIIGYYSRTLNYLPPKVVSIDDLNVTINMHYFRLFLNFDVVHLIGESGVVYYVIIVYE